MKIIFKQEYVLIKIVLCVYKVDIQIIIIWHISLTAMWFQIRQSLSYGNYIYILVHEAKYLYPSTTPAQ